MSQYYVINHNGSNVSVMHDDEIIKIANNLCKVVHKASLLKFMNAKRNKHIELAEALNFLKTEDIHYPVFANNDVIQVKQFIAAATKLKLALQARELVGNDFAELFHEDQINVHTKFIREPEEGHIKVLQVVNKWLAVTLGYAVTYDKKDYELMFAVTVHGEVRGVNNTGYKELVQAINLKTGGDLDIFVDNFNENKGLVFLAEKIRQIILSELLLSDDSTLGTQITMLRNSYTAMQALKIDAVEQKRKIKSLC